VLSQMGAGLPTRQRSGCAGAGPLNGCVVRDAEFPRASRHSTASTSTASQPAPATPRGAHVEQAARLGHAVQDDRAACTVTLFCVRRHCRGWRRSGDCTRREGLRFFVNDPVWPLASPDPGSGPAKTYHVHIDRLAGCCLAGCAEHGVFSNGEHLKARSRAACAAGTRACLEIVLEEGRHRQD